MAAPLSFSVSLVLPFFLLCVLTEAKEFLVGGDSGAWTIPSSAASRPLNRWAEANRFQVGDSLVWKYDGKNDAVLQVTREDYFNCNTSSPIAEHRDGDTSVELSKPGPYYFISGAEGACEKGEKLIVVVMSGRHRQASAASSPAPSPAISEGPAAAPASGWAPRTAAVLGRGFLGGLTVVVFTGLAL